MSWILIILLIISNLVLLLFFVAEKQSNRPHRLHKLFSDEKGQWGYWCTCGHRNPAVSPNGHRAKTERSAMAAWEEHYELMTRPGELDRVRTELEEARKNCICQGL